MKHNGGGGVFVCGWPAVVWWTVVDQIQVRDYISGPELTFL